MDPVQDDIPKKEHKHLPLPFSLLALESSNSTPASILPNGSFEPKELAALVIHFSKLLHSEETICTRQEAALVGYQENLVEYSLDEETGHESLGPTLANWFTLLDELLFLGTVSGTGLTKLVYDHTKTCQDTKRFTTCEKQGDGTYEITVFSIKPLESSPKKALRNLIFRVIHEMIHVYLKNYSCESCLETWEGGSTTGHGVAWLDIMGAITKTGEELGCVDNTQPYCAIPLALELLSDEKKKIPCESLLERWGIREEDVKFVMDILEGKEKGMFQSKEQKTWFFDALTEGKLEKGSDYWLDSW